MEPDATARIAEWRRQVESALDAALPADPAHPGHRVVEAARYSLLGGGKRVRPLLLLLSVEVLGRDPADAMPFAAALEMIHTYSLIHDDLPCMDDDSLRRGRPTCHVAFGEATAVLAGDTLLNRAAEILLAACCREEGPFSVQARLRASVSILAASGVDGMIGGQALDLEGGERILSEPEIESLHRMKTGALLRAPLAAAVLLADAAGPRADALLRLGETLGLAFQVQDDILDAVATADALGKTPGKDQARGKSTYVTRLGLETARARLAGLSADIRTILAACGDGSDASGTCLSALVGHILDRRS